MARDVAEAFRGIATLRCKQCPELLRRLLVAGALQHPPEVIADLKKARSELLQAKKDDDALQKVQRSLRMAKTSKGILDYLLPLTKDYDFVKKVNRCPHELPVAGGRVLDLKTLESRPRTREDLFSFEMPVTYEQAATRPNCERFFQGTEESTNKGVCHGDQKLLSFMQRLLGYALTGEVDVRSLFILWGSGQNGKSSLIDVMKAIQGEYFTQISEKVLINQERRGGATPELMPLVTARLAVFSESEDGAKLNSTRIKNLTGSDDISARQLYAKQVTFRPQAKLFMMTNHLPDFDFRDRAMLDRVKLIPFRARFEVNAANTKFVRSLMKEHLNEVFSWIAEGARAYYAEGIGDIPECCSEVLADYIEEQDTVAAFIQTLVKVEGVKVERGALYKAYEDVYREDDPVPKRVFYKQMTESFPTYRTKQGERGYEDVRLRNEADSAESKEEQQDLLQLALEEMQHGDEEERDSARRQHYENALCLDHGDAELAAEIRRKLASLG